MQWHGQAALLFIACLVLVLESALAFVAGVGPGRRCAVKWSAQTAGSRLAMMTVMQAKKNKKSPKRAPRLDDDNALSSDVVSDDGEAGEDDTWGDGSISPELYDKLRSEATEPFRRFRIFCYAGIGFGAAIGGLTALTQLAATVANQPDSLPLGKAVLNVVVDWAVVGVAALAWNFENNLRKKSEEQMAELRAKEVFRLTPDMKARREKTLSDLLVTVPYGQNETITWKVKDMRERAKQHLMVLAAPKAQMSDALLGAKLAKTLFIRSNLMIVPYVLKSADGAEAETSTVKGFGQAKDVLLDKDEYIAKPAEEGEEVWKAYIDRELSDAEQQNDGDVRKMGIGIVMNKDGRIIRRGLGQPDWKLVVSELQEEVKPGEYEDSFIPMFEQKKLAGKKNKK